MPRRTFTVERPSRHGNRVPAAPRVPAATRGAAARRLLTAAAPAALAAAAPLAHGEEGVVSLSAGPGFDGTAPAWVDSVAAPAAGPLAGSVLPAGHVSPAVRFGPHGAHGAGPGGRSGGRFGGGGWFDPAVAPAGYAPAGYAPPPAPAPYCPPGAGVGGGGVGGAGVGGGWFGGGGPIDYVVRGGLPKGPGSLWTSIARMQSPEGNFVRLEYLRYSMTGEETGPVGAPVVPDAFSPLGPPIPNATIPTIGGPAGRFFPFGFDVFDERNAGNFTLPLNGPDGPAVVAGLNNNDVDELDGARFTIGRGIKNVGRAEFNAFAFNQETFTIQPQFPLLSPALPTDVGIPTTLFGGPGAVRQAFDVQRLRTGIRNRVLGDRRADVLRPDSPGTQGFGLRPLVGVRYLPCSTRTCTSGGSQRSRAPGLPAFDSRTVHHGSQQPVRAGNWAWRRRYRHDRFTVGVRPSVTAGLNQAQVRTRSVNFGNPGDGVREVTRNHTQISPLIDLAAYLRIPLGETFKLSVGYDLLYLAQVARPNESTSYNSVVDGQGVVRSAIRPTRSFDDVTFNGLTIGLEMLVP